MARFVATFVAFVLAGVLLPPRAARAGAPEGPPPVTVVFRYDDYSATSDMKVDRAVIDLFRRRSACLTIGAIPLRLPKGEGPDNRPTELPIEGDKAALLRQAVADGTVEVAMHGLHHRSVTKYTSEHAGNEWAGVPYRDQVANLKRGKALLESACGGSVTTFVPPWNSYDADTVKALQEAGFTCLSARRRGVAESGGGLAYIPATCHKEDLQVAVAQAERLPGRKHVIVVLMHPKDFTDPQGKPRTEHVDALLKWLDERGTVRTATLLQVSADAPGYGPSALTANKACIAAAYLAPPVVKRRFLYEHLYFHGDIVTAQAIRAWAILLAVYGTVVLAAAALLYALGRAVFRRRGWPARAARWIWPLAALCVAAWGVTAPNRNWRGALILTAVFGASLGLVMALRRRRKLAKAGAVTDPTPRQATP